MEQVLYQNYLNILRSELIMAMGCTEPIAIAYASAKARQELGVFPERIEIYCSGNIVKNVKGVTVPNSGGQRGIDMAAVLGVVGGNADNELQVLASVTPAHQQKTRELLQAGFCQCFLEEGVENLYIRTVAFGGGHSASVTVKDHHTFITQITRDDAVIYENHAAVPQTPQQAAQEPDRSKMDLAGILQFADEVELADVLPILEPQVRCNSALADEGLTGAYGAQIGLTLQESSGSDVAGRAILRTAAASEARMGGCALPAVINSGSGNQGITVSLPVVEYARGWGCSEEKMYRALVVSNLVSIHQKKYIGSLSAYCGVVSAACAAGAGIMYLYGGDYDAIGRTITNSLGNVAGIVCDGAKSSCASKIVAALTASILAFNMSRQNRVFQPGEGLVQEDVESTIRAMGHIGKVGMRQTDTEILNIMLDKTDLSDDKNC